MIFEAFIDPKKINKNLSTLFMIGLVYTSIAIILSIAVFKNEAAMVMVFFTVMAIMPYMYNSIKHEEHEDLKLNEEKSILKSHTRTILKFLFVFFGMVVAFAIWFVVLPPDFANNIFNSQLNTINIINSDSSESTSGNVILIGYLISHLEIFQQILFNNLVVLLFCLVFSFLFGFGAIFILTWNASVIGAAIGTIIRSGLEKAAEFIGADKLAAYFNVISYGILRYSIHGIPEILSYFVAGLAGGIISVAAIRHDFRSKKYHQIIIDSADLIILAVGLVFISAIIEVYITPLLF